jgi:hypothetical protein
MNNTTSNNIPNLISQTKYFVHKGTWKNDYEWRIQRIKITGVHINDKGELYAEFSFSCCGYEYPLEFLKDRLDEAKKFAIDKINEEKERQINQIQNYKEEDCLK